MSAKAKDAAQDGLIDSVVDKAGTIASPVLEKLKPVLNMCQTAFVKVEPYIELAFTKGDELYTKIEPYHPEELFGVIVGFVLCFYGSCFCTTIAAVEAFRMCGYSRASKAFNILREQFRSAEAKIKADDDVDADGDGIKDVAQLSTDALVKRKMKIALKTCDPDALSDGLQGLYAGMLAVVATLQLRFAQVLTLGASLGDGLEHFSKQVTPSIEAAVEPEFRKWVPQTIGYACKIIGVSLAWMVQRVIFGFTSAVKGSQMLCRGLSGYLVRHEYVNEDMVKEGSPTFNYVETIVAALGFYAQFSRGFGSLGWFGLVLFPLTAVEWTLGMLLGSVA